jgi:hypothetical protein
VQPERIAVRQKRVLEVVGWVMRHAEPLHHTDRSGVPDRREGDDLVETELLKAKAITARPPSVA